MIDIIFYHGSEIVLVRIVGNVLLFKNSSYGLNWATIEGMKLDYSGVIKEFPELKDEPNWKQEAICRFKDKIKDLKDENKVYNYVVEDLKKFGYVPKFKQKQGFRREIINGAD